MKLIHDFFKINDRIRLTRLFAVALLSYFFLGETIWLEKNILVEKSLFFAGTLFVSLGVMGRAWCSSYIAGNKDAILIKTGPYSLCRNPLYFFSLLGALGVGLCTKTFIIPSLIISAFFIYYTSVIKKEESSLREKFGTEYELYYRRVPRFFPSLRYFVEEEKTVIVSKSFRKSISELIFFIIIIGFFEFVEGLHKIGWIISFYKIY